MNTSTKPPPRYASVTPTRMLLLLVIVLSGMGELSTQIYVPSLPLLTKAFGVGRETMQHTLTAFVMAFGIGQLIYGPLSDRFGRRPVLIFGLSVYGLATLACLFADSATFLIAARAAQGFGACAALVLARAITRDVWGVKAVPIMTMSTLFLSVCTALSPALGGVLTASSFGWQASFAFLLLVGVALLLLVLFAGRETNTNQDPDALRPGRLLSNYVGLLCDRNYMRFTLLVGMTYGALFTFISTGPLFFIGKVGLTPREYGLCFGGVVVGMCLGMLSARFVAPRLGLVRTLWVGIALSVAGVLLSLLLSGLPTLWTMLAPQLLLTFGAGLILPNAVAGAVIPQATRAGLAAGLIGFMQMAGGALFGVIAVRLFDGSLPSILFTQLAAVLVGLASFYLLGPRAQRASRPAKRGGVLQGDQW